VAALERKAVVLQMDVPLQPLKPGLYLCQVNIIDDVSGTYAFPASPSSSAKPSRQPQPKPESNLVYLAIPKCSGDFASPSALAFPQPLLIILENFESTIDNFLETS
jgi:hypothetical protein